MMRRLFGELGMREETKDAEPVIYGHQHDSVVGEGLTVEEGFHSRSGNIASAMNPDHHGHRRVHGPPWRPHVPLEAVLAASPVQVATLNAGRPETSRITDAGPGLRRERFAPAQVASRWLRKWNTLEDCYSISGKTAAKLAGADGDRRIEHRGFCRY